MEKCLVDCLKCPRIGSCCEHGVWVDLEKAKKITNLELYGQFYHLKIDEDFPSGYAVDTTIEYEPCSFLCADGKCVIHKIDYELKPEYCKEFPYADGKVPNCAFQICIML